MLRNILSMEKYFYLVDLINQEFFIFQKNMNTLQVYFWWK